MNVTELAKLSDDLFIATLGAYSLAMVSHTAEYAFSSRKALAIAAVGSPGGKEEASEASTDDPSPHWTLTLGRFAVAATVLGVLLHAGSVLTRGFAAERVPWGNMYEFLSAVCLAGMVAWLVLCAIKPVRHLGMFVLLPVVLLLGLAGTVLYAPIGPLVPALDSVWLKIHVSTAAIASGVFLVGFVTAVLYLVRDRYEHRDEKAPLRFPLTLAPRLPKAESLELLTFRLHALAFPLWTFAVIAGAIWAEAAWTRYWGWDPKETWAFISWVVYAAYLHARSTAGWQGRKATTIAIIGWATMLVNLFVINFVTSGLHSYA